MERNCRATGYSSFVIKKIREEEDIDHFPCSEHLIRKRRTSIDPVFGPIVQALVRNILSLEKKLPAIKNIHDKLVNGDFECF